MEKMNYEQVMEIVHKCERENEKKGDSWFQFRSCQAYFTEILYLFDEDGNHVGNYRLFKSYRTIVALVDFDNQVVYRLGKWSSTTSKQTTQFCNQHHRDFEQVQF